MMASLLGVLYFHFLTPYLINDSLVLAQMKKCIIPYQYKL